MKKTCGNCEWLKKDKGKPYYCAYFDLLRERHKGSNYHEESDIACADWRYGEQEAGR